jgi:cysteine desulfurase
VRGQGRAVIYLDHHAATPISTPVREAMARAHEQTWGNPESVHAQGRAARALREAARHGLAAALGAKPADLVLAGSGTEALNLAVLGLARGAPAGAALLLGAAEHPAVLAPAQQLQREGFALRLLPVLAGAPFSAERLQQELSAGPAAIVAVQWVNHETGTLFPVAEYAAVCRAAGVPMIVDACQAFGRVPIDVGALGAAALVVSAAKIGAAAGVSALWHERGRALSPVLHGGQQERGFRPGTADVAALAGFAAAARAIDARLRAMPRVGQQRDRIERAATALGGVVNADQGPRVASVSNVSFRGWRGDVLVAALDVEGLCVSAGAACSSGLGTPSPVLQAMYPEEPWRAESALRISLGPETTDEEVEQAIEILTRVVKRSGGGG